MLDFLTRHSPPGPADPQLLADVAAYIDAHYVPEVSYDLEETCSDVSMAFAPLADAADEDEFGTGQAKYVLKDEQKVSQSKVHGKPSSVNHSFSAKKTAESAPFYAGSAPVPANEVPEDLEQFLKQTDAGFSETLLKLIDRSGEKDSAIYRRANVDRRLFSKIRSNPGYRPSKATAVAFAIALQLNVNETNDLIGRAGYVLSHSSEADLIAEFFIKRKNYDIGQLNEVLYARDLPLLGGA